MPYLCRFLARSVSITSLLPVCGLSVSAAAAVMFILSATPPPPCTETLDTQALLGTFNGAGQGGSTGVLKYTVFIL